MAISIFFLLQHIYLEVSPTMGKKTSQPGLEYSSISEHIMAKKYIFGVYEVIQ